MIDTLVFSSPTFLFFLIRGCDSLSLLNGTVQGLSTISYTSVILNSGEDVILPRNGEKVT